MIDLTGAEWRKAERSSSQGNCVQVATNLDELGLSGMVAIQDSKNPGPALLVSRAEFAAFLNALK